MDRTERIAWTVAEASAAAGVSRSTGYQLVRAGIWPSCKVNSLTRVPREELLLWIRENTTGGRQAPWERRR